MSTLVTTIPESDEPQIQLESPRRSILARLHDATLARPDLRNGILSLFNQALVNGTNFATCVIIGRISKQELGLFYLGLTIVYLVRGIQDQLIVAPYVIYCQGRRGTAQSSYFGSSLVHHLALSGVVMLSMTALLAVLSLGFGPPELVPVVWMLLAVVPFLQLREFLRRVSIAHLRMATAMAVDLTVATLQLGGIGALAYYGMLNVTSAYVMIGAACALAAAGWFFAKTQPLRLQWARVVADWRHNWAFARWTLTSHLIGFTTPSILPWIVTVGLSESDAGVFAACVSVVGIASTFMTGLAVYVSPRAAMAFNEGGIPAMTRVMRVSAAIYAVVLGGFALTVLASGDHLLVLVFGAKYAGYGTVIGVLALGMTVMSFGLVVGIGLCAIDRPKANLIADVCTLVVTLSVVFCLLEPMGVLGAAIGDLSGKSVGAAVRYATLRRLLQLARDPGCNQSCT